MVFKCQEDSFLKVFTSEVVSCTDASFETVIEGKKSKLAGYEVVCKETIFFPEGGGQPFDQGYLNDKLVHQVLRKGDQALHYITEPLKPGDVVKQTIDWERRFDHMQQHSGQHLVTAIIDRDFGFKTLSWWLGEDDCHIELDVAVVTEEQIQKAEQVCNELIRAHTDVRVEVYNKEDDVEKFKDARARGLPDDHKGDIRVITIDGVESNMCCGTHVSNLSQLQVVKLLHCEKGKRKNTCLLHFLIGNRVLKRLGESLKREQKITTLLNNGPDQHTDVIDKLVRVSKVTNKNLQTVLKDLAKFEVDRIKSLAPKYVCLHKKEAEGDFMNLIVKSVGTTDIFLFLSTGDEKGVGNILLSGKEGDIAELGNKICDILSGKGAGKGTRFQAKVSHLNKRPEVEQLLKEYFN